MARLGNLASGAREVGVKNPSHRFLKCPLIFGLYYNFGVSEDLVSKTLHTARKRKLTHSLSITAYS